MKNRGFFKFILSFGVIISIFIIVVINFDKFTLSYNERKEKHQNPYYIINEKIDIIQQIKYYDSDVNIITDISTINNIKDCIKNNETIKKIILEISEVKEEDLFKYIDKIYNNKQIKKVTNLNSVYGDIIYINNIYFDLVFTLD